MRGKKITKKESLVLKEQNVRKEAARPQAIKVLKTSN